MMVSTNRLIRIWIPVAFCSFTAIILFMDFFLEIEQLGPIAGELSSWAVIMGNTALIIGTYTFLRRYGVNIIERRREAGSMYFGALVLIIFVVTFFTGLILGKGSPEYRWMWDIGFYTPPAATIYGLTGVYLFMGAYRGYRAHNLERFFYLLTGLLTFLYLAPIGELIWPGFIDVGNWLWNDMMAFAVRGVVIGMGLAFLLVGLRYLATLDKGYLGAMTEDDE